MTTGTTLTFHLREGWTLRKVASALAREWLPPFRAEPPVKAARWVVQSVVEDPNSESGPLWEAGISTQDYEERLDRADLRWVIRASAGRGKGIILARLSISEKPTTFELNTVQTTFPETLFDAVKIEEFLAAGPPAGEDGLFAALLAANGFEPTPN